MADDLGIGDSRVVFMADYLMKTLKIKGDKWNKLWSVEDNKILIGEFCDKSEHMLLCFALSSAGALTVSYTYPTSTKTKAIYFAKKQKESLTKDMNLKETLLYGDLSYSPLDQLSAILDEVILLFLKFTFDV